MRNSGRVEVIDALRGVAALAVVLYHYIGFLPLMGVSVSVAGSVLVAVTRYGYLGVPVFFVLSGYVIAMTASRYQLNSATGSQFVLRRLVRLAPAYWAMVSLIAGTIVVGWAFGRLKNTTVTLGQVIAHFTYTQELLGFPALDVAYWTLCLEVQFYLVFAASAVAVHRCPPGVRVGWFAALTIGSVLIDLFGAVAQAWFACLWYQFGIGVLTCLAGRERSARLALGVLLPAVVGVGVYRGQAADITVVLVAGLLLCRNHSLVAAPARIGVLLGLGQISYSLYLVHGFVGMGLGVWFRSSPPRPEMASWIAIAVATAGAIGFAAAFYYFCERRAVEWSRAVRVGPASGPARDRVVEIAPNPALQTGAARSLSGVHSPLSGPGC